MENRAEVEVRAFFEQEGFVVSAIPRRATKTPDFVVAGDTHEYLVEVKVQDPPRDRLDEIARTGRTEMHIEAAATGARASKLEHVERQLRAYQPGVTRLRIHAVVIDPAYRDALALQLRAALYGMRSGITGLLSSGATCAETEVYYFDTPQFARYPDIDLVLMFAGRGVCGLLNEFSPRAAEVRSSRLANILDVRLHDPRAAISSGEVIESPAAWRSLPVAERTRLFWVEHQMQLLQIPTHIWTLALPVAGLETKQEDAAHD
jgi:hypothetical protein